jgi:integrase
MASLRKKGRVWYYRYTDGSGLKRERRGCPDKRATEEMARQAETESARVRSGLSDPKAERMAEAGRRLIKEHLADFIAIMKAKGDDSKHVGQTETYSTRVIDLGMIKRIADLAPSAVMKALTSLRADGLSARTLNAHVTAIKAFSRWLHKDGRCADNPLATIGKMNEEADRRLVRRPLSEAELRRLLDSTRNAPDWRGMSGLERALLYTLGAMTGFRRSELGSLTPESFHLDEDVPIVVVAASLTKNGKLAEQPLPRFLVDSLASWLARKAPGKRVFDSLPEKTGLMLKNDLRRCGIKPVDDEGRVVDMHSLRHGFITMLAKAGVPIKVLQTLARHSDPKLTLNIYSHLTVFDTAGALDALPDLSRPTITPEAVRMTGTDSTVTPISDRFAHHLPTGGDGLGRVLSHAGGIDEITPGEGSYRNSLDSSALDGSCRDLTEPVASAPRRTRTYNPLIKSQLLCQLS